MLTCICLEASSEYRVRGARSMPGSRSTEKEARDSQNPKLKSDNYVDSNGIRGHYFRVASHLQGILFERTVTRGEVYRKGHTKLSGKAWNITKSGAFYFYPERDKRDQSHHGALPGASNLLCQSRRLKQIIMFVMHHQVFLHLWSEKHASVWTETKS
jgi:hypothetical protein